MEDQEKLQLHPRILVMITREEDEKKVEKALDSLKLSIMFQCRAKGTAPSELMDILGFRGTTRVITMVLTPKCLVDRIFVVLNRTLFFHQKGGGIAFTIPLTGIQGHIMQLLNEDAQGRPVQRRSWGEEDRMKGTSEFSVIWVSVASGFSDEVIDVARSAGARGGTIIKGRRRNSEKARRYFGISIQDEQDFVMILASKARRTEIMAAISDACGLKTKAHGTVLALPVDEVMGLEN